MLIDSFWFWTVHIIQHSYLMDILFPSQLFEQGFCKRLNCCKTHTILRLNWSCIILILWCQHHPINTNNISMHSTPHVQDVFITFHSALVAHAVIYVQWMIVWLLLMHSSGPEASEDPFCDMFWICAVVVDCIIGISLVVIKAMALPNQQTCLTHKTSQNMTTDQTYSICSFPVSW